MGWLTSVANSTFTGYFVAIPMYGFTAIDADAAAEHPEWENGRK